MQQINIAGWLMTVTALILGITFHEWAHAIVADKLGDDTPRKQGRITLWPLAHLDPIGTVLMLISTFIGFGIGWGKPVMTRPGNYKINPRLGSVLVSIAGPLSNLVIAAVFGLFFRFNLLPSNPAFVDWMYVIVSVNATLFIFNLLPLHPLDGSKIVLACFPLAVAERISLIYSQVSLILFMTMMFTRTFYLVLGPLRDTLMPLLVGAS